MMQTTARICDITKQVPSLLTSGKTVKAFDVGQKLVSYTPVWLRLSLSYFKLYKMKKTDSNANDFLSTEMQIVSIRTDYCPDGY